MSRPDDPLLSYNLLLLLCICLSGFFMYLFVRGLSGSSLAGVLSGIGYAFSPYLFFELGRIQLVAAQWIPLFALFLHRVTAASPSRLRDMLGLGLAFAMQVGSCLYYAVFLGVYAVFVGGWLLVRHRPDLRKLALHIRRGRRHRRCARRRHGLSIFSGAPGLPAHAQREPRRPSTPVAWRTSARCTARTRR